MSGNGHSRASGEGGLGDQEEEILPALQPCLRGLGRCLVLGEGWWVRTVKKENIQRRKSKSRKNGVTFSKPGISCGSFPARKVDASWNL